MGGMKYPPSFCFPQIDLFEKTSSYFVGIMMSLWYHYYMAITPIITTGELQICGTK